MLHGREHPPGRSVATARAVRKEAGFPMNNEHIKGAADKAKGAVKDAAGKLVGNERLQAEGKIDKAKGEAHKIAGDVKDAVKDAGN
jgi:uncharacterized protein YjbJ (UPF0337 family)